MPDAARGVSALDEFRRGGGVVDAAEIDWQRYLRPEDRTRIVPAQSLAEKAGERLAFGPEEEEGLRLPWEKTSGRVLLRKGKLAVWAGWTHHGKTAMLKQVMLGAIQQSERCLICSLEEEVIDVYCDMATMACGEEKPRLDELRAFNEFVTEKLWLFDQQGTISAERMLAVVRYAAAELGVTQVVIDSLMLIAMGRDDYEAQARFISQLHAVAKDSQATVHLVAHMRKREGKFGDEAPGTVHDIAGGHEIASIADYVFLPWRDKRPNAQPACQLKVEKQRGRINWLGTINLNFHNRSRQFVEDVYAMRFWE